MPCQTIFTVNDESMLCKQLWQGQARPTFQVCLVAEWILHMAQDMQGQNHSHSLHTTAPKPQASRGTLALLVPLNDKNCTSNIKAITDCSVLDWCHILVWFLWNQQKKSTRTQKHLYLQWTQIRFDHETYKSYQGGDHQLQNFTNLEATTIRSLTVHTLSLNLFLKECKQCFYVVYN